MHATFVTAANCFLMESEVVAHEPSIEKAKGKAIRPLLWTNIRMAPDTQKVPNEDSALDFRNFPDSWMKDTDGALIPCWDGFSCNPSSSFSLGQAQFARLTAWVEKYELGGIFLDLYGDTVDVDSTRSYGRFPFFPLQVAETQ